MKFKSGLRYLSSFVIGVLILTSVWLINDYKIVRSESYPANAFWSSVILTVTLLVLSALVFLLVPRNKRSSRLIAVGIILVSSTAVSAILLIRFGDIFYSLLP
ncbi:MAG: hypothetical protein QF426_01020 [Verrucomicrobiales bacterium]|jgi:hypothetical protein|nr:hypothetical protein [Verrucomicrobiales bacterium]MEC7357984.1 hypothetical protein [Verrucomicrobiota bacterium]